MISGSSLDVDAVAYLIIMFICHALINTLSAPVIHNNLNMIFCTHVEHSPTKTIYIKHYTEKHTHYTHTHTHKCLLFEQVCHVHEHRDI